MGAKRRYRATAKKPVSRETYERFNQYDRGAQYTRTPEPRQAYYGPPPRPRDDTA